MRTAFGAASGLVALAVLGGCATSSGASGPSRNPDGSLVLSGLFAGNQAGTGEVRLGDRGAATFTARGSGSLSCTGTFAIHGSEMTQFVPFTCTDARNGQAVVTLRDDRASGSIVLVYDDGAHARFAFGSLPFSEAFEAGGSARG